MLRDAIIRGRERARGGPFRVYRCPRCLKESMIEEVGKGRMFASPAKEISLLDYLFGWIEPLAPEDFLRIVEWQSENAEERRRFFEEGGDHRYSLGWLRRLLGRLRPRRRPGAAGGPGTHRRAGGRAAPRPSPAAKRSPRTEEPTASGSRPARTRPRGVPHPYRILGLGPDATDAEIRVAFRALARRWHPDKQRDPARVEEATRRWNELLRAYESIEGRRKAAGRSGEAPRSDARSDGSPSGPPGGPPEDPPRDRPTSGP